MTLNEKIKALLDKAAQSDHEAEAALFLDKAQALMTKHQISMIDLDEDDEIGHMVGLRQTTSAPSWKKHLTNVLAKYYGCKCVINFVDRKTYEVEVFGPESARVTFEAMLPFVTAQIRAEGRKAASDMGLKPEAAIRRVANAFNHRVSAMLVERDKAKNAAQHNDKTRNALVAMGTALDAYVQDRYPNLEKGRKTSSSTNSTARAAANKVSLARQTGGSTVKRIGG